MRWEPIPGTVVWQVNKLQMILFRDGVAEDYSETGQVLCRQVPAEPPLDMPDEVRQTIEKALKFHKRIHEEARSSTSANPETPTNMAIARIDAALAWVKSQRGTSNGD